MDYKHSPSEQNLKVLRAARDKVQQTARHCANKYWSELSEAIQTAAVTGNIRGMYDSIKRALAPVQNKTAPIKSCTRYVITDRRQQMKRFHDPAKDRLSTKTAEHDRVLTHPPTWKALNNSMATSLSPSASAAESSKAASLPPPSSGSSSHWCWSPPSAPQQGASTCALDQMTGFSISPASEPRSRPEVLIRDMLCADDVAVATHMQRDLQSLMGHFFPGLPAQHFGLTINLRRSEPAEKSAATPMDKRHPSCATDAKGSVTRA